MLLGSERLFSCQGAGSASVQGAGGRPEEAEKAEEAEEAEGQRRLNNFRLTTYDLRLTNQSVADS
ncbi:hypothetical protein [Chroococcidiopsis sp.]|uniref:hypothetical protein n=1 Tax=Chroococcidiopsis sp. TaxID=3088168 RepID=UPI003F33154B